MSEKGTLITFGKKHRGKLLSDPTVPNDYILWLCTMPSMKSPTNSFEAIWKCPGKVWAAAMKEADVRGYKPEGDGWIRKDDTVWED